MGDYKEYLNEVLSKLKTSMYDSGTRPILFAGTGISRRYIDAPDWKGLLNILIEKNPNIKYPLGFYLQDSKDLAEVASKIVDDYFKLAWENKSISMYPDKLYEYPDKSIFLKSTIAEIINSCMSGFDIETNSYKDELSLLANLNPHAIITTNYDTLIENIFSDKYKPVIGQQVIRKSEVNRIGQIFKIHGCVTNPEEIIISSNDYDNFKKKQKYLSAKLLTYFIELPIIFIGYSISDENIIGILRDIADMICVDDNLVENIWLVDWSKDTIGEDERPPTDKVINLGDNKTIRINYIKVNDYIELFKALHQGTSVDISELCELQDTIYNIVKSKTITNLEVDVVSFKDVWSEENILSRLGLDTIINKSDKDDLVSRGTILNLGVVNDPERILVEYPYRISDIAEKALGDTHWYRANKLITEIEEKRGISIKCDNNEYHIDIGLNNNHQHRYSDKLIDLLIEYTKEDKDEYSTELSLAVE